MTNAWVQPILIVALIFAIIFGLTGIPGLIDRVKNMSATDSFGEGLAKNQKINELS